MAKTGDEHTSPPASHREHEAGLSHAFETAERVFWCNSNRGAAEPGGNELEERMHTHGFAAAWVPFVYPEHMRRVRGGGLVFLYAKELGVIGVGVARESRVEILGPDHPGRLRAFEHGEHEEEWRVPVEWLAWDTAAPCPVVALRTSFQEITDHEERVRLVRKHFLPDV